MKMTFWTNQDSCDKWVILEARNTFHRATTVEGERLSVIFHTPQHLNRLLPDDWEELRRAGFPVDEIWQGGLITEADDNDEERRVSSGSDHDGSTNFAGDLRT